MGEFEFLHVTYSITGHSVPLCLCACIRLQYGRVRVWCGVVFRFLLRRRLLSLYVTSPGGGNQTTFWRGRRSSGGRRQRFGCRLPTCLALCRAVHFRTAAQESSSFCRQGYMAICSFFFLGVCSLSVSVSASVCAADRQMRSSDRRILPSSSPFDPLRMGFPASARPQVKSGLF